jgi:hypothetical protein
MNNIELKDTIHQINMERDGYIVLSSFLDHNQISTLINYYKNSGLNAMKAQPNYLYANPELSEAITETISAQLKPSMDTFFSSAKLLGGVYMVKPPGGNNEVDFHQDWSLVDEQDAISYNLWCPLTDTTSETGALILLKNSHKCGLPFRSSSLPPLEIKFQKKYEPHMLKFNLKAGDAILYRHSMFHGSENNRGNSDRVAIACGILPSLANFVYQHWDNEKKQIQSIRVDQSFYIKHIHEVLSGHIPSQYKVIKTTPMTDKPYLNENDFFERIQKENKQRKFLYFKY